MATEEPQVQGEPAGNDDLPSPSFSDQSAPQSDAEADALVNKLIENLTPKIESALEKRIQSIKDSRLDKVDQADRFRKALRGRSDLLAELEGAGVEIPKDVRMEMRIRELEEQNTPTTNRPATPADNGMSAKAAVSEAIAELSKYGLDSNDAEFIGLLRGKYANRDAFDLAVTKHVVKKLAPQPTASPAGLTQAAASAASQPSDVGRLISELNEWQKTPSQYRQQIKERVAELDKRGWK